VVVALAAGCGLYTFLRYREAQLASAAALSFDSAGARALDSGIMAAPNPAVVLGQSILSDSAAAELAPKAGLAASSTAIAIGEFRARLELTQPVDGLLLVRYRDSDPGQAIDIANAVAEALATWTPSAGSAPPPAANAQPAPASNPAPAPVPNPAPASDESHHTPPAGPSLAAALADLQAQLSSANQRVDTGASLQSGHDRQRYLESQVRAAQQKLGDLRKKSAHSGTAGGQTGLEAIQHALADFWPSAAGLNTAGTSGAQLRYEREQLARDILIVEQQRKAALLAEAANPVPAAAPPQAAAPAAPQPQPAPMPDVPSSPAPGTVGNPLHLERTARLPAPIDWWPSALVGCACGLLYWGLVFASYRFRPEPDEFFDSYDDGAPYGYSRFDDDQPDPDESLFPDTSQTAARHPFRDSPHGTSADPNLGQMPETPSSVNAVATARSSEEQDDAFRGRNDESDPWGDKIRQNLSQTTVGRTFDTPNPREESGGPKGPARDASEPPSQANRRRD
jgi:hypothetical protein